MADSNGPAAGGVGARRKGPKSLPKLPMSVFSGPPSTGTQESFPLPPSPNHNHPTAVIDTNLSVTEALEEWSVDVGKISPRKINGVVLALAGESQADAIERLKSKYDDMKILSVLTPVDLTQGIPAHVPSFGGVPSTLSVSFAKSSPELVEGVRWALQNGYILDLEIQSSEWEAVEELFTSVFGPVGEGEDTFKPSPGASIILSNYLPPPHDLEISIVKLMNHPSYRAFQASVVTLSLFPSTYVKYTPPRWVSPTPRTPSSNPTEDTKEKKEWKRRMRMFLGPVIEAFGFERIMYGSSSAAGHVSGPSADWYELAREALAELGVDQESVDAVFEGTAKTIYHA